jgi:bifunctional non-homologous end joining protein LigD
MPGRWGPSSKKAPIRPTRDAPGTLPSLIEPQLATLVNRAPTEGEWSYEIKFDGYRMLARVQNGTIGPIACPSSVPLLRRFR